MSFVNKFKNFIGYDDDEYYDENYTEDNIDDSYNEFESQLGGSASSIPSHPDNPYNAINQSSSATGDVGKVVNIHASSQLKVVLVKPERFEDASGIADHLNAKRTIVLNLESANKEVTRRLIDFLSGVAYANNGQIKRVANSTYIITPYNVDIVGDLLDEIENSGVFF